MGIFRHEADLRKWMRDNFDEELLWIEPGIGSTFGVWDTLLMMDRLVPIELKCYEFGGEEVPVVLRDRQKDIGMAMLAYGIFGVILIAEKGTERLWMVRNQDSVYEREVGDGAILVRNGQMIKDRICDVLGS